MSSFVACFIQYKLRREYVNSCQSRTVLQLRAEGKADVAFVFGFLLVVRTEQTRSQTVPHPSLLPYPATHFVSCHFTTTMIFF